MNRKKVVLVLFGIYIAVVVFVGAMGLLFEHRAMEQQKAILATLQEQRSARSAPVLTGGILVPMMTWSSANDYIMMSRDVPNPWLAVSKAMAMITLFWVFAWPVFKPRKS